MENKTKKTKVDYAAIIREYEMYARGRSLKQFCDDSDYVYPNVLRYYRKCFWNSKSKLAASPEGDKSLVPLEIEPAANDATVSPAVEVRKPDGSLAASAQSVPTYSIVSMHISFSNGMELSLTIKPCVPISNVSVRKTVSSIKLSKIT